LESAGEPLIAASAEASGGSDHFSGFCINKLNVLKPIADLEADDHRGLRMLDSLNWTHVGKQRLAILAKYEPIQPFLFMELTRAIDAEIFLDVGANIGAYSVLMASLQNIKTIHAFEPTPDTFDELNVNIGLNSNSSKIKTHRLALSDARKSAVLGIVSQYSGANSIVDTSIHSIDLFLARVEVNCISLDEMLMDQNKTLSLKIDVEGHEHQVLAGAKKLLTLNTAIVQIENYNPHDPALEDTLRHYGYRLLFSIDPDQYFSNSPFPNSDEIITTFSRASSAMISDNFAQASSGMISGNFAQAKDVPIRVHFPIGISVELSGPVANLARRARQVMRRSR
jgi:FkbM family methyltransferase